MKRLLLLVVVIIAGAAALGWSFRSETLPVGEPLSVVLPKAQPPEGMRLSALPAGKMFLQAGLAYRGGSLTEPRVFAMAGILVRHPRGTLLFDTGFGKDVDAQVRSMPRLMQLLTQYEKGTPVAEQLHAAGIEPDGLAGIVLTHSHWDHVGGIPDLEGVPVWVNQEELDFIRDGGPASALLRSFGTLPYHVYGFPDGRYLGFDQSYDVFGDGAVVVVPAPGHTPGSIIAFVNLPSGRRYALIGDLVWQKEGIELPAERPWLTRSLADFDPEAVRRGIVHMHQLEKAIPSLVIVPAHDSRVLDSLPRVPESVS